MKLFETDRLSIEEIETSDAAFYLELVNSPGWLQNIGDRGVKTMADAENYIKEKVRPPYEEFGFGFYKLIIKTTNEIIGTVGLIKRPILEHVDIGFALLPQYFKKGYALESAQAMLDYAMQTLKLNPVLAVTAKDNIPSQRLLEKIGLSQKGVAEWDNGEELFLYST